MTDAELLQWVKANESRALTFTLYGEARNESITGRIAVGCVIRNRARAKHYGSTIADVCLWPRQFSCWKPDYGPENYAHLMSVVRGFREGGVPPLNDREQAIYDETCWVTEGIVSGVIRDLVNGATHYYSPRSMVPAYSVPRWVRGPDGKESLPPVAVIGGHRFFRGIA